MNFDLTEDQRTIKDTAREFLGSRFRPAKLREAAEAATYDDGAWREIAELGWPGIAVPEENGGQGLGELELVLLMEELGYACAPTPFFGTVAAALALTHAGSDAQKERWLPGLASGEQTAAVGVLRDGVAALVPDAADAGVIVLLEEDGARLVAPSAATVEPLDAIDRTRRYARVRAEGGEELPGDVPGARDRICVALAGELTGLAQRTMEMAVAYAKERHQFGRPIGAYQAVSHRCAQMLLEVEGARSLSYWAAWTADAEPETLPAAAAMAKAYASDAGWRVTASSLQVHAGIGFTWEHDLHFFLKRAKTDGHLLGSATEHRARLASLTT